MVTLEPLSQITLKAMGVLRRHGFTVERLVPDLCFRIVHVPNAAEEAAIQAADILNEAGIRARFTWAATIVDIHLLGYCAAGEAVQQFEECPFAV